MDYSERTADWHDDYVEKGDMNVYLISDTHFNHANIATYCDRPKDFTELIIHNWENTVKANDLVIHLGDVILHKKSVIKEILQGLPGRKILVRGNHDRQCSNSWWMENGFDFSCDGLRFRSCWLSHEPENSRPGGCDLNIHGHLHNVWHGFQAECLVGPDAERLRRELRYPWQRLFAVEYTHYMPVEFDKFVSHPDKYQARGPK